MKLIEDRVKILATKVPYDLYFKFRAVCDSKGMKLGKTLEFLVKEFVNEHD